MADPEPELLHLLESLESHAPSLEVLPPPDDAAAGSWGSYFLDGDGGGEHEALGEHRRQLRSRIMTAIGNCRSLRKIDLNPWGVYGMYSVRDVEATALLKGLKHNRALQWLSLCGFGGFGTRNACIALAAHVLQRPGCRLEYLGMDNIGLGVEGLAHISSALRDNSSSRPPKVRELRLDYNDMIGNGAGARHVATILSHSPALRTLGLIGIGMDEEGAVLIAEAVALTTTLDWLYIGYDRHKDPGQAAMMIPILRALSRGSGRGIGVPSSSSSKLQSPLCNDSITQLGLIVTGLQGGEDTSAVEARLEDAVGGMLHSNTTVKGLQVTSYFVTRGLSALAGNSSITFLEVLHLHSLEEEKLDPVLMPILHKCRKLDTLRLSFHKPYGPSNFIKELFQGLKQNKPSIRRLVLDGWGGLGGLDDDMVEDLIRSLSTNTTSNLEEIFIDGTLWEMPGKGGRLSKTYFSPARLDVPTRTVSCLEGTFLYPIPSNEFHPLDKFLLDTDQWCIVRPPAVELTAYVRLFPPRLDGPAMQHFHALADQLMACGNEEEMAHVCLEMRHYLDCHGQDLRFVSFLTPWSFTWVETLLLEREMLWDASQEAYGPIPWGSLRFHSSDLKKMRSISSRWERLHSMWLPLSGDMKLTMRALDIHRRLALLCCGQDTEAVENFQAPDYWKGFELCYLCCVASQLYNNSKFRGRTRLGYGTAYVSQVENRCLYWLQRAERAVPRATVRGHEHRYSPLVRLKVLLVQVEFLGTVFGRTEVAKEVLGKVEQEIEHVDLQLRFDFPVPLPDIQYLKWDILQSLGRLKGYLFFTGLVPDEIGPELVDMLDAVRSDSQTLYALACLVLRGQQLIFCFNMVEKGLDLLETCLTRLALLPHCNRSVGVAWPGGGLEFTIKRHCSDVINRSLVVLGNQDRVDRLLGFLVAQGLPESCSYVTIPLCGKRGLFVGSRGPLRSCQALCLHSAPARLYWTHSGNPTSILVPK